MAASRQPRLSVRVTVIPVSVRQNGPNGRPTLMAWPGLDGWARRPMGRTAEETAQRVLTRSQVPGAAMIEPEREPAPVAFIEEKVRGGVRLTLLYTVPLPMALCDPEAPLSERWIPLLRPEARASEAREVGSAMVAEEPFAWNVIDYWRQQLEGTGAGLQFLARYWTMPQLRDVYSAVWGYEQDTASFSKWALKKPGALAGLIEGLDEPDLTDELADALATASQLADGETPSSKSHGISEGGVSVSLAGAAAWQALANTIRPAKAVGLSMKSRPLIAGALPAAALAGVAAVVAYQASTRGPTATWYTTTVDHPEKRKLKHVYAPRPAWLGSGD